LDAEGAEFRFAIRIRDFFIVVVSPSVSHQYIFRQILGSGFASLIEFIQRSDDNFFFHVILILPNGKRCSSVSIPAEIPIWS
jgi:hypothetical protein